MTQYNMLNVKLSNSQLNKLKPAAKNGTEVTLGLLGSLSKTGLSLIGNALKPLAKNVLILLGLTTAASARDAAIRKRYSHLVLQH